VCTKPESESDGEALFANSENYTIKTATKMKVQGQDRLTRMTISGRWLGAGCGDIKPVQPQTLIRRRPDRLAGRRGASQSHHRFPTSKTDGDTMNGLMMQQPLLISSLLVHAERHHGDQEVVSRRVEGDIHRETYRELAARSRRLPGARDARRAQRPAAWPRSPGTAIAHGAVLRGLGLGRRAAHAEPRLHPDHIVYNRDHAEDEVLFFDMTFMPIIEAIASRAKTSNISSR